MLFAVKAGVQFLSMESDCHELTKLWNDRLLQRPIISPILTEMYELSLRFVSFDLHFANRSCNRVAHQLAWYAMMNQMGEWQSNFPLEVLGVLRDDCNHHNSV